MDSQVARAAKRPAKARKQQPPESAALAIGTVATAIATTVQTLIRWGAGICIAYFAYRTVEALAGKQTGAHIALSFLGNLSVSSVLGWSVGGVGALYGLRQRRLKGTTIARLEGRIRELETESDPNRTSSNLTPRGDTNPEDKR